MQKSIFTLAICFICACGMLAQQHATCNGTRYISDEFSAVTKTTAIQYGNNTTVNGANQNLFMDIYEPTGDVAAQRPVVMLAFGGSFIGGTRQDLDGLCDYYAKRGFVAVTIDYRLYDKPLFPIPTDSEMTDEVIKAVSDMKAAVRFLREDAATTNTYKIDPTMIFVGGISAGAIVADHVAYVDSTDNLDSFVVATIMNNGGWQGNSSANTQYSSEVQGVLNFSGALKEAAYIAATDPPLFSAHDDMDGTVPYNGAFASIFSFPIIYVEGSGVMHTRANTVGIANHLITIPNSNGHVSFFQGNAAQWEDTVRNTSCQFLHDNVICPVGVNVHQALQQNVAANFFPNPAEVDMVIEFESVPSTYSIQVFDNMGRQIYNEAAINESRYMLERHNFAAGVYFVNIQFEDPSIAPVKSKVVFQ